MSSPHHFSPTRIIQGHAPSENEALKKHITLVKSKNDKTEEKLMDMRKQLTAVKSELEKKDRQLDVAKKMLQKVSAEKKDALHETEMLSEKARRLERAVQYPKESAEGLMIQLNRSRQKNEHLDSQLRDVETKLLLAEDTNVHLSSEVSTLKGALGLKAGLAPDGNLNNQSRLLYQLSKSQEQQMALALQLAENETKLLSLQHQLEKSQEETNRALEGKGRVSEELNETIGRLEDAVETMTVFKRERESLRDSLESSQAQVKELSAANSRLEAQLRDTESQVDQQVERVKHLTDKLQSVEKQARMSMEALRNEVTIAVDRAESRTAEQKAKSAVREATLNDTIQALRSELDEAEIRFRSERDERASDINKLKLSLNLSDEQLNKLKAQERERALELGRMHGQVDTLSDKIRALQESLAQKEEEVEEKKREILNLKADEMDFKQHLARSAAKEAELQDGIETLSKKLAVSLMESEEVCAEAETERRRAQEADARSGHVDSYVAELHKTIENLTESKTKLQSYMLSQIELFKEKLQAAERDNRSLRDALTVRAANVGLHLHPGPAPITTSSLVRNTSPGRYGEHMLIVAFNSLSHSLSLSPGRYGGASTSPSRVIASAAPSSIASRLGMREIPSSLYDRAWVASKVASAREESDDEDLKSSSLRPRYK